jgi:hypothetical protein
MNLHVSGIGTDGQAVRSPPTLHVTKQDRLDILTIESRRVALSDLMSSMTGSKLPLSATTEGTVDYGELVGIVLETLSNVLGIAEGAHGFIVAHSGLSQPEAAGEPEDSGQHQE